jgi:cyclic-di-GMP phosphodiesterase TipF (flagellum assembly factor)
MIRISTIFIAICMVLISASVGMGLYGLLGLSGWQSALVALAALTFLILYNAVSMRLRDRSDVGTQIADLSRGTADLARQVAEFGRRLVAAEHRLNTADGSTQTSNQVKPLMSELNELGSLVRQLAITVAAHEQVFAGLRGEAKPPSLPEKAPAPMDIMALSEAAAITSTTRKEVPLPPQTPTPAPSTAPAPGLAPTSAPAAASRQVSLEVIKEAVEANRLDLYLQPIVTLPQRKVRYYEAVARLRESNEQVIAAADFVDTAEAAGLLSRIDHQVLFRCVQVLRRLMNRTKDIGIFCNIAASTLSDPEIFPQCLEFLQANRALAPVFVLEFTQSAFRTLGPAEIENLASLSKSGFRFSIDNVTDLKIDPRELADRNVRFIKIPGALLLDQNRANAADIHTADLSDLLGRFGIDLIAERIEGERAVVDLLDYDVRYGQGFLFSPPRPIRADQSPMAGKKDAASEAPAPSRATGNGPASAPPKPDPALTRTGGMAALARRVGGPT